MRFGVIEVFSMTRVSVLTLDVRRNWLVRQQSVAEKPKLEALGLCLA